MKCAILPSYHDTKRIYPTDEPELFRHIMGKDSVQHTPDTLAALHVLCLAHNSPLELDE